MANQNETTEIVITQETDATSNAWCNEHYPGESLQQRFLNALEEMVELGCSMSIDLARMNNVLVKTHEKSAADFGNSAETPLEMGDVEICLAHLAEGLGVDRAECRNMKMRINRRKTVAESASRKAKKRAFGL